MTYKEKQALYESVMRQVAKTVKSNLIKNNIQKRRINEELSQAFDKYIKDNASLETFNDSSVNKRWKRVLPNEILLTQKNKIGFAFIVTNWDDEEIGKFTIMRDSLGEALDDFRVMMMGSISSSNNIIITVSKNISKLSTTYHRLSTEDNPNYEDSLEDRAEVFATILNDAKTNDDLIKIFADA